MQREHETNYECAWPSTLHLIFLRDPWFYFIDLDVTGGALITSKIYE